MIGGIGNCAGSRSSRLLFDCNTHSEQCQIQQQIQRLGV